MCLGSPGAIVSARESKDLESNLIKLSEIQLASFPMRIGANVPEQKLIMSVREGTSSWWVTLSKTIPH